MTETLELPTGETVTPEDAFLHENYPYRFVPREDGLLLRPLYWGGGDMDVPLPGPDALAEVWGPESRGTLSESEWRDWLREAHADDRFGDDELDAIERELLDDDGGLLDRLRRLL